MVVTHQHLLEWTTAAAAQKQAKGTVRRFVRSMAGGFVAPVAALVIAALRGPAHAGRRRRPGRRCGCVAPFIAQRVSRHYEPVELAATAGGAHVPQGDRPPHLELLRRRS